MCLANATREIPSRFAAILAEMIRCGICTCNVVSQPPSTVETVANGILTGFLAFGGTPNGLNAGCGRCVARMLRSLPGYLPVFPSVRRDYILVLLWSIEGTIQLEKTDSRTDPRPIHLWEGPAK